MSGMYGNYIIRRARFEPCDPGEGMTEEYFTRMGDGRRVYMTRQQIMDEIHEGMSEGADAARIPSLTDDEMEAICDVICMKTRIVGVEPGEEAIISNDGGQLKITQDSGGSGVGIDMGRGDAILLHERAFAHDTFEIGWTDYSIKAIKPIIANEMQALEQFNAIATIPLFYGAMPNMGLYSVPDGPYGNPADLMRCYRIEEAREASEKACDHLARDITYVTTLLDSIGCEGFNFDTVGSAGDADFVATLRGCEAYREISPNAYINFGMSSEHVIGIHGEMEYDGKVVAGMYPHEQVKLAAKAGANVFGAAVNTNTCKSYAWNVARAICMIKECVKQSPIPVHADLGMGVGGVPMHETPPVDATSRSSKLMTELAHVDGV